MRYDVDAAQDIATQTQAYEAQNLANQFLATTLRSQSGTAAALTTDTRANRASTTGSLVNDLYLESDTGWLYRWTGTTWAFVTGIYVASNATRTALTISAQDNGALFLTTDTDLLWQVAAGSWVQRDINAAAAAINLVVATTDHALTDADDVVLVDSTAGDVTVTLHDPSTAKAKVYTVKKIVAANDMILDGDGADIDGAATITEPTRYTSYSLVPGGTGEWFVI